MLISNYNAEVPFANCKNCFQKFNFEGPMLTFFVATPFACLTPTQTRKEMGLCMTSSNQSTNVAL